MQLTERQRDALSELINIGFARAGASLSDLTGQRVVLEVPQVAIHRMSELNQALGRFVTGDVATVHQIFTGPVAGHALLLLDYDGAVALKYLLTDEPVLAGRLDASAREVLTEVGNILLNSCLGMFGNLLQVQVSFSVPQLHLESLRAVLDSLLIGKEELKYAILVHTGFLVRESDIKGFLVIVLGVASLDRLIYEVERWEERQV
ncbi:MAG TPA: chemotaxis protein CheC [Blastocatellia bacterium]|nr:chemotaxis protein CheC [Blastocatellia bacterium]